MSDIRATGIRSFREIIPVDGFGRREQAMGDMTISRQRKASPQRAAPSLPSAVRAEARRTAALHQQVARAWLRSLSATTTRHTPTRIKPS
jgi:hypothetical protein